MKELRQAEDPWSGLQPVSPKGFARLKTLYLQKHTHSSLTLLILFCREGSECSCLLPKPFVVAAVSYQLELLASQQSPQGVRNRPPEAVINTQVQRPL